MTETAHTQNGQILDLSFLCSKRSPSYIYHKPKSGSQASRQTSKQLAHSVSQCLTENRRPN